MTTNLVFLVVVSALTYGDPEWKSVADALTDKHREEARVARLVSAPSVTDALEGIKMHSPTHVAFVMKPEEAQFKTIVSLKRMMRALDDDPFDDAIWGIVTGPTAADAKRIATSHEPSVITSALTTTGVDLNFVPGAVARISDANPPGCWATKNQAGEVTERQTDGDTSYVFAKAWNEFDPEFILTSAHASQRNLEMPFSRGNIVPHNGRFMTVPGRTLIDYSTGQAMSVSLTASVERNIELKAPTREKVWLAAGNCLIADNLQPGENMVMTALGFGKVNQFVGYTATTWFGEIGWGTWSRFAKGMPLVDAYFAANEALIKALDEEVEDVGSFNPEIECAADYDKLIEIVRTTRFKAKHPIQDARAFVGRLWDRDATVFYGDPLHKVVIRQR